MDNKEKAKALFRYIRELYAQKYRVVTDIRNQEWYKFVSDIPNDDNNIILNYKDNVSEEELSEQDSIILKIHKPEFDACLNMPKSLEGWIENDWQRYDKEIIKINEIQHEEKKDFIEKFEDDKNRLIDFENWINERDKWVKKQYKIAKTRNLFNELYLKYTDLERDSEVIELMIGQGVFECNTYSNILHPILLKRVKLELDAENNTLSIIDTDIEPELYTMLFQDIELTNHLAIKKLKEELNNNYYYHPLDRNDTPEYLERFSHMIDSNCKYVDKDYNNLIYDKFLIRNNPVFFIRKKTGGVIKSIEEIIEHIEETGEIPGPILNLIGENVPEFVESIEEFDLSNTLAAASGEDKEILLSKEANKEQLDIARRIEKYNAVLVQGPPGTGKTHTIANLIGHFLAQGKNILVTSHTKKALSVLKDKVEKDLQGLCVSVLDDNNRDMEKTIDSITEYISSHSSLELKEESEKLKYSRLKILEELAKVRKQLYAIRYKEFEEIVYQGKGYSVSSMAQYVNENNNLLNIIPGKVELNKPLPVSKEDLEFVYCTNETITPEDEQELLSGLTNPKDLTNPDDFKNYCLEYNSMKEELDKVINTLDAKIQINNDNVLYVNGNEISKKLDKTKLEELNDIIVKSKIELNTWLYHAILAGKKDGGYKKLWQNLVFLIKDTYDFADKNIEILLGKNITGSYEKNDETIKIIEEIAEYIDIHKKIPNITLMIHKKWKEVLHSIRINENTITNLNDCDVIFASIKLDMKRKALKEKWDELIGKHSGETFNNFGDEPEQTCINYISEIENAIAWYDSYYANIVRSLRHLYINESIIQCDLSEKNPMNEIKYELNRIYTFLPNLLKLIELIYFKIPEIKDKIFINIDLLRSKNIENSNITKNILHAIEDMDFEEYLKNYNILDELYTKNHNLSERVRIINDIEKYASQWANYIKFRIGIHGKNTMPENIEKVWKCKQFSGIIDEITEQPFEELQKKASRLTYELRQETTELLRSLAWYNLLTRVEGDISKKQALQGWKLTIKKLGKATGKRAPELKREAKKLMTKCQTSVPAWIMPISKALETIDTKTSKFDIVIIDEASQSDISALAIMYLAKKIIIVGDDEQVSPSAVGIDNAKMLRLYDMHIKNLIPNSHLYDLKSSLYDITKTTFPTLMLKEHFRCVPDIIGYSNRLSYDYKIKPLRDDSKVMVKPATISYRVDGSRHEYNKTNDIEVKSIVALMLACMKFDEYKNMTMGVISLLGEEQAERIKKLAIEKIGSELMESRHILCGNPPQFQGDERDIIFISMVDSNEGDGPLRLTGEGVEKSTKQRYNVAVSRAKNQIWVVHSLDVNNDLKPGDMRRELIEYMNDPKSFTEQLNEISKKSESQFEIDVAKWLKLRGYNIVQQWQVGSYRIDMVVICENRKVAIECDGDLYHSGDDKLREDMERQVILERLGWIFIRIRGSEYYREPESTMKKVQVELNRNEIYPESNTIVNENNNNYELKERVIDEAVRIIEKWKDEDQEKENLFDINYNKIM